MSEYKEKIDILEDLVEKYPISMKIVINPCYIKLIFKIHRQDLTIEDIEIILSYATKEEMERLNNLREKIDCKNNA